MKVLTQSIIALVLLVVVTIAYGIWFSSVEDESAQAATLAQNIKQKTETAARASAVQTALNELESDEATVSHYFVTQDTVVPFLEDLEALGRRLGTEVKVTSVGAVGKQSNFLSATLTIQGSFDSVLRTVGAIEYSPYDLSVATVDVGHGPDSNWVATISLVVGFLPNVSGTASTTPAQTTSTASTTTHLP